MAAGQESGAEVPRLNGDDVDAQVRDLILQRLGESGDGVFRRAVDARDWVAAPAAKRAHGGYYPRLARSHVGEDGADEFQKTEDVSVELGLNLLGAGAKRRG